MNLPKISIIVPTKNREELVWELIKLLENQKFRDFDLWLIDDSNEDQKKLEKITSRLFEISMLQSGGKGPAFCRNMAMKKAKGEIFVFINDDSKFERNFLSKHYDFHQKHQLANEAVVGSFVTPVDLVNSPVMRWLVLESKQHFVDDNFRNKEVDWSRFWTCNLSVKSRFIKDNNLWFDENFKVAAWEDVEMGFRMSQKGLKLYKDSSIKASHWHYFDYMSLLMRFRSHGEGLYYLSKSQLPGKYWPPLARGWLRVPVKYLIRLLPVEKWSMAEKENSNKNRDLNNLRMQLILINEKIKGWGKADRV